MHTQHRIGFMLAGILALSSIAQAQTIYEWRNNDGERNYSDMPPDTVVVEESDISITPTNSAAIDSAQQAKREQAQKQGELDTATEQQAKAAAALAQKQKDQRTANCEKSRQKLASYNNARRIYETGPDGEISGWLDVDEERAKAQKEVGDWCN